jgi:hypothetical protein
MRVRLPLVRGRAYVSAADRGGVLDLVHCIRD